MAAAVCRVCGTDIDEAPRLCPKCDTPHHPDCWTYTGTCSVYGCGGGEGVATRAAGFDPGGPAARAVALPADVPVAGAEREVWFGDEFGAWIGRPDPAIPVQPGERIVMIPPSLARRVLGEDVSRTALAVAATALLVFGCVAVAAGARPGVLLLPGAFGAGVFAKLSGAVADPAPDRAWFSRTPAGVSLCTLERGKQKDMLLRHGAAPRSVVLSRSYEPAADGTGGATMFMTYDLQLVLSAGGEEDRIPLAPPLQLPDRADQRRALLDLLVARRALGHHIAGLLQLPFEEGASR